MAGAIKRKTRNGKPSAKWHATFTDEDGITRTRAGFTDKAETLRFARRAFAEFTDAYEMQADFEA